MCGGGSSGGGGGVCGGSVGGGSDSGGSGSGGVDIVEGRPKLSSTSLSRRCYFRHRHRYMSY